MRALYLSVSSSTERHADGSQKSIEAGPYISCVMDIPSCSGDQLVVKVQACALSLWDSVLVQYMLEKGVNQLSVGHSFSGVVHCVGPDCSMWQPGDSVMGVIPADANCPACAEFVTVGQYDLVSKPAEVSHAHAASCLEDMLKAYTALIYLARIRQGDTVFIPRGATAFGSTAIQLACNYGGRVITSSHNADEASYLDSLQLKLDVIDMSASGVQECRIHELLLERTLQLGVDIVIDQNNDKLQVGETSADCGAVSTFVNAVECSLCLAVGGRYVTQQWDLQLDSELSRRLTLKCCSVGFLMSQSWLLSSAQLGRYQHILLDAAEKLQLGLIRLIFALWSCWCLSFPLLKRSFNVSVQFVVKAQRTPHYQLLRSDCWS